MNEVHLLVTTEVIKKLSERFVIYHKDGNHGYFGTLTEEELWCIARSLVASGHRIDIKPGKIIRLVARKE